MQPGDELTIRADDQGPTKSAEPERASARVFSEDEWADVRRHALMVGEQDQRHKALFFDGFVGQLVSQINALRAERDLHRTVLGYALDSLQVVLVQHCMDNGMPREEAEKAEWQAWTHPANTIRAIKAALAEASGSEPTSSVGNESPRAEPNQINGLAALPLPKTP